ncbi:MAG: hypothetical protein NTZ84_03785 [Candidatus Nealsonbacteria bacterium]|nr:hypothetical protein [Candidatus Nealsonbacteria bacterium]
MCCDKKTIYRTICYGVIIWVVAFMVVCVLIALNVTSPVLMQGITTLAVLTTAFMLAKKVGALNKGEMLKYTFSWALTSLILDYLVTTHFTGMQFFSNWYVWAAYALLVMVPLFAVKSGPKIA